ncbi:hypothetical protein AaE_010326, partial [Aphanomyces astaci]
MSPRKGRGSGLANPTKRRSTTKAVRNKSLPTGPPPMVVSDKARRVAWGIYFIDALGAPPSSEWTERLGTVYTSMQQFKVPRGSRDSVLNVLEDVRDCCEQGVEYDGSGSQYGGLNKTIALHTCKSQIVADCMELGMGLTETTHMVNEYQAVHDRVHVGRNAAVTLDTPYFFSISAQRRWISSFSDYDSFICWTNWSGKTLLNK